MAVSWRPDQLDPPRPVSARAVLTNRHQAVQSSRRRKGTRCRAVSSRGAAREDWGNHGTHSRMRRARGQPRPRRMDDGDRDAGVHEGKPKQGVRPHLVGRDRLVQARQEVSGFGGVRGRPHRFEKRQEMTAATAPRAARGRAREGAPRRKELEDDHDQERQQEPGEAHRVRTVVYTRGS